MAEHVRVTGAGRAGVKFLFCSNQNYHIVSNSLITTN